MTSRLYYRITDGKTTWFFSGMQTLTTPERQLKAVQRRADQQKLGITYTLTTFEEYDSYRKALRASLGQPAPTTLQGA